MDVKKLVDLLNKGGIPVKRSDIKVDNGWTVIEIDGGKAKFRFIDMDDGSLELDEDRVIRKIKDAIKELGKFKVEVQSVSGKDVEIRIKEDGMNKKKLVKEWNDVVEGVDLGNDEKGMPNESQQLKLVRALVDLIEAEYKDDIIDALSRVKLIKFNIDSIEKKPVDKQLCAEAAADLEIAIRKYVKAYYKACKESFL